MIFFMSYMVTLSGYNKSISAYLDYYQEHEKPYFAVLIDGDWLFEEKD